MDKQLECEKRIFDANIESWRKIHSGEYVLIKNENIVGFFPGLLEASDKGMEMFGLDDFFVTQIVPEETVNVTFLGQRVTGPGI